MDRQELYTKVGLRDFFLAARLRTLPLSMSGIILGSFVARWRLISEGKEWDCKIFLLAILVAILYQVLSNFANDYGDAVKGTDKYRDEKVENRAVSSGKITLIQMKKAVGVTLFLSFVATIMLIYSAFFPDNPKELLLFLILGILCICAAIGYTVGKKPYGYLGLGDIMVFIFFGLLSVCGSYYLFTKQFHYDILFLGSSIGFLSVAVLNLNNIRDMEGDRLAGKYTLALRLGLKKAMIYQMILLHLPLLLILIFLLINHFHIQKKYYVFGILILHFPFISLRRKIRETKERYKLDSFLKPIGMLTLFLSILLGLLLNNL